MRIQKPCSISAVVPYSAAAIDSLQKSQNVTDCYSIAGTAKDGSFGWLAKGGALEVFDLKSGHRFAAWCFGTVIKDPDTLVTAVCEFANDHAAITQLVVATTTLNPRTPGGMICLFDIHLSAVVKAFRIPYEVTSLETIAATSPGQILSQLLYKQIQSFCGTVAVGTQCGHLYLLDLCTDENAVYNELTPRNIEVIYSYSADVVTMRYQAISKHNHLCLELEVSGSANNAEVFTYYHANESAQCCLKSGDVYISCLKFVKQNLTLFVGFTFGGFQLWDLKEACLQFSSLWQEDLPAVTHFAFQEPENDPRDYCYIWVVHGPTASDDIKSASSHMSLYQLSYHNKEWIEDFGFLYETLGSLTCRFNHELHFDPYDSSSNPQCGSRVIACYTLENHQFKPLPVNANDSLPVEGISPDRSLCLVVWEAVSLNEPLSNSCFLSIFDINSWYHAQLPSSLNFYKNQKVFCPYWAVCCLDDMLQTDQLLMVFVDYNYISRFSSPFIPLSEKFMFPSALAFDAHCISESGLVLAKFIGIQRLILGYIQQQGHSILLNPHDIFFACTKAGLIHVDSPTAKLTVSGKREQLLSMALDYNIVGFVVSCIEQLSNAEYVAEGFTMRSILEWAWNKLADCKVSVDKLCVPLFDWSGFDLPEHDVKLLHHQQTLVRHLKSVFQALNAQSFATTEQGKQELTTRLNVVNLIADYIDVIIWFHAVGLLPEHSEEEELYETQFAFPSKTLAAAYMSRRQEIENMNRNAKSSSLLVIDGLLEIEGASISEQLKSECGTCLYPPVSFHALIKIFLLPDVANPTKFTIVLYFLRDLIFLANAERAKNMEDICKKFCSSFNISPNFYRHLLGLWLLDHQHFQQALPILLESGVSDDVPSWQHAYIIKAFLCQGYERLALKYMKVKTLPVLTADDVKLRMTVLLANGLTSEALDYQRTHRDGNLVEDLMSHMILACLETRTIGGLLNLPLSKEEENHLVKYLQNSNNAALSELVVLYYLQRSRLVDAINLNNQLKYGGKRQESDSLLGAVVDGYKNLLPSIQCKMNFSTELSHHLPIVRREYARPTPLSSALHSRHGEQVITRATLLNTVLDKVHELNVADSHLNDTQPCLLEASETQLDETCMLFGTPIVPASVKKSRLSSVRDMIFPSSTVQNRSNNNSTHILESSVSFTNPTTARLYSAAALSLLHTPPIVKHKAVFDAGKRSLLNPNPQSILSVKRLKLSSEALVVISDVPGTLRFDDLESTTQPSAQFCHEVGMSLPKKFERATTPRTKTLRFLESDDATTHTSEQFSNLTQPEVHMSTDSNNSFSDVITKDEMSDDNKSNNNNDQTTPIESEDEVTLNLKTSAASIQTMENYGMEIDDDEEEPCYAGSNVDPTTGDCLIQTQKPISPDSGSCLPLPYSLRRPPLWEKNLHQKSLASSGANGTAEQSNTVMTSKPSVSTDVGLQISICEDSIDEVVESKLADKSGSGDVTMSLSPIRRSARLQRNKDHNVDEERDATELSSVLPRNPQQLSNTELIVDSTWTLSTDNRKDTLGITKRKLEADFEECQRTSTQRRSLRSPGRESMEYCGKQKTSPNEEVLSEQLSTKARSVHSPSREVINPLVIDNILPFVNQGEEPCTPTRRRSFRSPCRKITETLEKEKTLTVVNKSEEIITEQSNTPTRRKSLRSPSREGFESLVEKTLPIFVNESEEVKVEQPLTPNKRRSLRSPSREISDKPLPVVNESEEVMVEQPRTSTRRRSVRSPCREITETLMEEETLPVLKESEVITERPNTPTRRRSVRSPSREVFEPLIEGRTLPVINENKEVMSEQQRTPTRRSLRSPSRDVFEPLVEEKKLPTMNAIEEVKVEQSLTPNKRRRSLRSPSREVCEPLMEDKTLPAVNESEDIMVEQQRTPTRRKSVRSPSREIIETLVEEKTLTIVNESEEVTVEQPLTPNRRRKSLRSPSREVCEALMEEKTLPVVNEVTVEQQRTPIRRRSVRSPSREIIEAVAKEKNLLIVDENDEVIVERPCTPNRRRSVCSSSHDITELDVEEEKMESMDIVVKQPSKTTKRIHSPSRRVIKPPLDIVTFSEDKKDEDRTEYSSPSRIPCPTVHKTATAVEAAHEIDAIGSNQDELTGTPVRRRFVHSPGREKVVIEPKSNPALTPTRRSLRQREKNFADTGALTSISLQSEKESKDKLNENVESHARKAQETALISQQGENADQMEISSFTSLMPLNSMSHSSMQAIKHQATEEEAQVDSAAVSDVPVSISGEACIAVTSEGATIGDLARAAEETNRLFVFSQPLSVDSQKDVLVTERSMKCSTFVFSPPHKLHDKLVLKQETELDARDRVKKSTKTAQRVTARATAAALKRAKKTCVTIKPETPSTDADTPILLSPVSDSEPTIKDSKTRKRIMKQSQAGRPKRKKFGSTDPPIVW